MPKLSLLSLATAAMAVPALAQAPIAEVSGLQLDPIVNPTVITDDGLGNNVERIHQCEVRHIGGGTYRVAATVQFWDPLMTGPQPYTSLLAGELDLSGAVPAWTPTSDFVNIDNPGATIGQFQVSVSDNGLVCAWDNYTVTTYTTPAGPQTGNTFVCTRTSTGTPFAVADVRVVTNIAGGGVDPHIGSGPDASGNVELFFIDFQGTPGPTGSIQKGTLDPSTGIVTGASNVVSYNSPPYNLFSGFLHSPYVHKDSTGAARCLNFSEYGGAGYSSIWFTEDTSDTGTPSKEIEGMGSSNAPFNSNVWLNNPGHIGGTWHQMTDGSNGEWMREVTMLANTQIDAAGNGRVCAWCPVQPDLAASDYVSVVGFGPFLPGPIPIAAATAGDLWISPDVISPLLLHNQYTGTGEWVVSGLGAPPSIVLDCQLATLNTATGDIYLSNTAQLRN